MQYKHIVQVHPLEGGKPNLYKVRWEFEYDNIDEAKQFVMDYNKDAELFLAVYQDLAVYVGCVDTETGELT